ncbi:MAG: PIN domain-containing protein [Solirubrobacteraceae bacterium]
MPGRSSSRSSWGDLPLVVDTSAWARAHNAGVREQWTQALRADRLRISPAARLEILIGARDGGTFDELAEELSLLRAAPLTPAVLRAAEAAMATLAHRSDGAHRIPIVDYLLAASAQESGAAVIHYDRDYDLLAEVMTFDSVWLAPPGSIP